MEKIGIGDTITYLRNWGRGPQCTAKVESIELCMNEGEKYGQEVFSVSSDLVRRCVFCLSDGHWCYGNQIVL